MSDAVAKQIQKENPGLKIEEDIEVNIVPITKGKPAPAPAPQPAQTIPWGIDAIQATQANTITKGAGITVCVVDTGVQRNHPDLAANIVGGENFVGKGRLINSGAWDDDNNHGTHVSGTIAALDNTIGVVGVAPEAKIFAAKVLDSRGSGTSSAVADGIRSCIANGADIVSMSLGMSASSDIVYQAVKAASQAGLILVAAAGNESTSVSYPAAYSEVIAISAVDSNYDFASFSNFGPQVKYAAPGVNVLSTIKGSSYASYNGTSMATPHAAGVYALMLATGKSVVIADDLGLLPVQQGLGLVNALRTVTE